MRAELYTRVWMINLERINFHEIVKERWNESSSIVTDLKEVYERWLPEGMKVRDKFRKILKMTFQEMKQRNSEKLGTFSETGSKVYN